MARLDDEEVHGFRKHDRDEGLRIAHRELSDRLGAANAERVALELANAALQRELAEEREQNKKLLDMNETYYADLAAAREDAKRYRWLRQSDWVIEPRNPPTDGPDEFNLDSTIDAAIAREEP